MSTSIISATSREVLAPSRMASNAITSCFIAAILSGCATAPTASAPTPVACAPKDSPTVPATTQNAELAKLDDYKLVLTIAADRLSLIDYAGKADAVIQACR